MALTCDSRSKDCHTILVSVCCVTAVLGWAGCSSIGQMCVVARAGTNTPSDEYDTYRDTGWRIRIYIREYSESLYSLGRVKTK